MASTSTVVLSGREAGVEIGNFLESCPTSFAQQTPGWSRVIEAIGPDRSRYLVCRAGQRILGVMPAHLCAGPLGSILTSAAQAGALGGVACDPEADKESVYRELLRGFCELARAEGAALATVYTNPLWPDHELCERFLEPNYVLENSCQVLDLERGVAEDGSFPLASENLRRNLKRAESGRLRVHLDASPASVHEWYRMHVERHAEIGATPLPEALFLGALEHMVPGKSSFFFVRLAEQPEVMVAGGFYVHHRGVIDALMPAFRSEYAELAPNFLLAAHTLRWARAAGLRYYNWQGSPPDGGVRRFKLQWGSADHAYRLCTRVTGDPARFVAATKEEIKRSYPWHYALPYDALGAQPGVAPIRSRREAAWKVAEEEG